MRASHPNVTFHSGRRLASRPWLSLSRPAVAYHSPRAERTADLRSPTSRFSFPVMGRLGGVAVRRSVLQPGLPRARRG
ncbi:MAG TPA: hypothetical protein VJA85_07725 [Candidatus Limnocylindria bacterium]|nr:hypothetical protein [Candidatus Limnocylindria bacterium]